MTDENTTAQPVEPDLFATLDIPADEPFDDGGADPAQSPTALGTPAEDAPAAVTPAAPEPPAASAPAAPSSTPQPTEHQVPVSVLTAERREYQGRLDAERAERAKLEARLAALEKPAPVSDAEPEFIEDPKGYVDAKLKQTREAADTAKAETAALRQELDQNKTEQGFMQAVGEDETAFAAKTADYGAALDHIRTTRAAQLLLMYPAATADQLRNALRMEERALAVQALNQGRSPAETAYSYAKTLGYQRAAAQNGPPPSGPGESNVTNIETARKAAATTLGSGGGGGDGPDEYAAEEDPVDTALRERFKKR